MLIGPPVKLPRLFEIGVARCVCQDHYRGLQTLCAMDGHDADCAARLRRIPLDLYLAPIKPVDEQLERRRNLAFERQCLVQQFLDWISCLFAEPCNQLAAPLHRT